MRSLWIRKEEAMDQRVLRVVNRAVALVVLTAAGGLTVAIVNASIPSTADGSISACYRKLAANQGTLRVIDAQGGEACVSGEKALAWNQAGVQGPVGPQGPQGAEGPPGTTATSHVFYATYSPSIGFALDLGSSFAQISVVTLQLPPGAYMVEARVVFRLETFFPDKTTEAECRLPNGSKTSATLTSQQVPRQCNLPSQRRGAARDHRRDRSPRRRADALVFGIFPFYR